MFQKFVFAATAILITSASAQAIDVTPPATATAPSAAKSADAAGLNSLAPHAGTASSSPSKVDYDALTRPEKIKFINQRHEDSVKRADLKWKAMSDDEKMAKFEKRRSAFMARRAAKSQQSAAAMPATTAAATTHPAPQNITK